MVAVIVWKESIWYWRMRGHMDFLGGIGVRSNWVTLIDIYTGQCRVGWWDRLEGSYVRCVLMWLSPDCWMYEVLWCISCVLSECHCVHWVMNCLDSWLLEALLLSRHEFWIFIRPSLWGWYHLVLLLWTFMAPRVDFMFQSCDIKQWPSLFVSSEDREISLRRLKIEKWVWCGILIVDSHVASRMNGVQWYRLLCRTKLEIAAYVTSSCQTWWGGLIDLSHIFCTNLDELQAMSWKQTHSVCATQIRKSTHSI